MGSPVKHRFRFHQERVLRKERGQGGGIVVGECLPYFHPKQIEFVKSLDILSEITRKSESPNSKADCQRCKAGDKYKKESCESHDED